MTPALETPNVSGELRLRLLHLMLLQRFTEERILALYRQGRIPGSVYTGYMQEAVAAAAGLALGPEDVVCPINREQACHYARGGTVADVLRNFLGKANGPTRGRDGNMHFGLPARGVFPLPSMLGNLVPLTVGAALAFKQRNEARVALTFIGDGQFSTGDVHEGLNLAGVLHVPAVFVLQSNGYAYSTPTSRQMLNTNLSERVSKGWSIPCARVDGTDALSTYEAIRVSIDRARAGAGPQAIEALTLRGHGHAAHDNGLYVAQSLRDTYEDPIERLTARLLLDGLTNEYLEGVLRDAANEVRNALTEAESDAAPDPSTLEDGVYATPIDRTITCG